MKSTHPDASRNRSLTGTLTSSLLAALTLIAAFGLASCGAAPASTAVTCTTNTPSTTSTASSSTCTDPTTNISVTISPATVSVNVVTEQQFRASISGGTNSIAIWEVNKIQGGNDTVGRIDSNGLYHAPTQVPSPNTVTVAAISFEDQNVSATSTVTITPAPVVTLTPPATLTVSSGTANTLTFSATETGGTTNTIAWSVGPVNGIPIEGGNATLGMITANGVYSAPATPPPGSVVTVTASAEDSPTSTASANVTVVGYSMSSLGGQFAFSLSGSNSSGQFFRAGSFAANGSGLLTTLTEDVTTVSGTTPAPIVTTGTYTVGADGRGTLLFGDGLTPAQFDFVLVNGTQLHIIGFDSSGTASGQAVAQDASTFSGSPASALNGTYVFDFSGVDGANALSQIGEFTADGAGNITSGTIDTNDGGATSPLKIYGSKAGCAPPSPPPLSSYTVGSNGRGTLTINTVDSGCTTVGPSYTLTLYIVSRGAAKFVGASSALGATTTPLEVDGYTMQQTPGATFSLATLNGNYAFLLSGSGLGGTIATAGSFQADGSGNVKGGAVDENVAPAPAGEPVTDAAIPPASNGLSYTVSSSGRGTASFTTAGRTFAFVFYIGAVGTNTTAVFQETDSGIASDGIFASQQGAPFSLATLQGNYAIQTSGTLSGSSQVLTGQLDANGAGATEATPPSIVDLNTGGTLSPALTVTGGYVAPDANGRTAFSLTPVSNGYAAYIVNSGEVFLLGLQPGQVAAGTLLKQF
jgi:hypothetical protein